MSASDPCASFDQYGECVAGGTSWLDGLWDYIGGALVVTVAVLFIVGTIAGIYLQHRESGHTGGSQPIDTDDGAQHPEPPTDAHRATQRP